MLSGEGLVEGFVELTKMAIPDIYIYVCVCVCVCVYLEREREREQKFVS